MNFEKSECFYCKGEIRGVKCISEIQQCKNRKVQGSSTQWFYFVSLGSEREHWAEKLGEMTGRGGLGGRGMRGSHGWRNLFQKAWIWNDRKRKETPEKVNIGFLCVCWLSFLSLFKEERIYRRETGEEVRKRDENNWWMEILEDQEQYQIYLRDKEIYLSCLIGGKKSSRLDIFNWGRR